MKPDPKQVTEYIAHREPRPITVNRNNVIYTQRHTGSGTTTVVLNGPANLDGDALSILITETEEEFWS